MLWFLKAVCIRLSINNKAGNIFCCNEVNPYFCNPLVLLDAEVAHLVEHDLAKVGVAGSSPVFRSDFSLARSGRDFFWSPGGEIGRHAGLKIL